MAKLDVFDPQMTRAVCEVLGATDYPGLTAAELRTVLWEVEVTFEEGPENKRTRLFAKVHNAQVRQKAGNALVVFVRAARTRRDRNAWRGISPSRSAPANAHASGAVAPRYERRCAGPARAPSPIRSSPAG